MDKLLDSGAKLSLTLCSFAEGTKLMKAVAREAKSITLEMGVEKATGLQDLMKFDFNDKAMNTIKNLVLGLLANEEVEAALWPCVERGTYTVNGLVRKINRDLFEDEKARADYVPILKEALVFNMGPFFTSLASLLKGMPAAGTDALQSTAS